MAFNSPGDRIPSHGTDMLGQRFAFDLIRVDRRRGWQVHPVGTVRGNLIGFAVREAYGWGEPVHMPFDGEIIEASDGYPERSRYEVEHDGVWQWVRDGIPRRRDPIRCIGQPAPDG